MTVYGLKIWRPSQNVDETILFETKQDGLIAAEFFLQIQRVQGRNWVNRSPVLWGNKDIPPEEWEEFKWASYDGTEETVTLAPIAVHTGRTGKLLSAVSCKTR